MESLFDNCNLCPRRCGADRTHGRTGFCRMPDYPLVNLIKLHYGEEPVISGESGSGTVFFEGCSLGCVFCQNYKISRGPTDHGMKMDKDSLSEAYLKLQEQGANNINLVTPMHFAPVVADSVAKARSEGLKIPVAVNCSGYELVSTLKLFDGLVDIYMPDMKYFSSKLSSEYSHAPDYFTVCASAIDEMVRQTGDAVIGEDGLIKKGVIVRHLILPGGLFDSKHILDYLTSRYGNRIYISLMSQYTPMPGAMGRLKERPSQRNCESLADYLASKGQVNAFVQEYDSDGKEMIPDFLS
ncbi:MAG: radical SAM protein [Clostridiales bacterium]|nr:radical SAM protein [Clostridiales bacterium]